MEHVLSEQTGLFGIHALGKAKVRAFDFSSPCCGDEYVTRGGQVTWIDIACLTTTLR
jgi:hypothetical protein